ncbi:hypothetical protein BN903_15 [Halorubrum sp. AJ67]|nr:hypothetical protein BN903_15 [Halorubrum sp. AJ67]
MGVHTLCSDGSPTRRDSAADGRGRDNSSPGNARFGRFLGPRPVVTGR